MSQDSGAERALPVLPLRGVVVFPGVPVPLIVGRPRSVAAVEAAVAGSGELLLLMQRHGDEPNPEPDALHGMGTVARVEQLLRLPDGNVKVLVHGESRGQVVAHVQSSPHVVVRVRTAVGTVQDEGALAATVRSVVSAVERFVKLNPAAPPDMLMGVHGIEDPGRLADMLVGSVKLKPPERQKLLETLDVTQRLEAVYQALLAEIEFLQVERKLRSRVQRERETTEREAWLSDQVKAIQQGGEAKEGPGREDVDELRQRLTECTLSPEAQARCEKEIRRLSKMNPMSAEATVVRNHVDWLLSLPWVHVPREPVALAEAATVLDREHFGLDKVKERVLEAIAVDQLSEGGRGPILCMVGPPGVGKTSFARCIAAAMGRAFARIALGGVRDEAEIRGHRRTYIGALPGRIVQAMKRAGTKDPVLLLDEVDKMSADIRGDPASALLEVLDPEQNSAFNDHFLDMDYDLSRVMFVCTANALRGVPLPLLDRLEIVELSGYSEAEKHTIAKSYLVNRQQEAAGLKAGQLEISDGALLRLIRRYTKESGVRGLERRLAALARKTARKVVEEGQQTALRVEAADLEALLGPPKFKVGQREASGAVGLVKGLSVSGTGGELLDIEVATVPGKGELVRTGKLGEVLKESASAVLTYVRSRATALGIDPGFHTHTDVHVHYPGLPGGVEGPSAGIAMATAVISALTGIPVRHDTAMTGEISLRGRVLRVGGIKEKVLAAHRGGITRVLVPEGNRDDLSELPEAVAEALEILPVAHMDRVLHEALEGALGGRGEAVSELGTDGVALAGAPDPRNSSRALDAAE